jgi:uncharacterized protein YndB with AHSA1/START domain
MSKQSSHNSRLIPASPEVLYKAFVDPGALVTWMAPGDMKGKMHHFDLRVGGGYEMSLFYPSSDTTSKGKTADREDRFTSTFRELIPNKKIVQAVYFTSADNAFAGEMLMEVTLEHKDDGTNVTIDFSNIPAGIDPKDNEEGTASSLEKLARYVAE